MGGATLTLAGTLTKNATVLRFGQGAFNVTGNIVGANANSDLLVDSAAVTLSNTNSYNGPTILRNGGALTASVAGSLPTATRSAVTMDDTGTGASRLTLGAAQQIASLTGAASSVVTLGANALTLGSAAGSTNFAGTISGAGGSLVKDGASTQILTGNNTYTGTTTISAGTLQIGNGTDAGSIGSTSAISNSGVLAYNVGNGSRTLGAVISGTGSLTQNSTGGTVILTGNNTYTGTTTISAGTLQIGNGTDAGSIASTSAISNSGVLAYNVGNGARTLGAVISGTGSLTQNSTGGTLTLSSNNTYSGGTTVNAGALNVTTAGSLASNSALTLGASGSANFANAGQTLGAVSNSNTATNALNFSAATGTVTLASLTGTGNTRFGSNAAVTAGIGSGTVNVVGALTANITGGTVGAASLTAGTVSGGTNTITDAAGITTLSDGTTTVGGVATIGTMSAGTANLNGATSTITTLNGGNIALSNSTALSVSSGSSAGVISGGGSLTKAGAGTLTLTGNNTYTGTTTISAGTLQIGNGSDAGSIGLTSSISNAGNLAFNVGSGSRTLGAVVSGAGSLTQNSAGGILSITQNNTYSGGTTINAGEIHVSQSRGLGNGTVTLNGNASNPSLLHYATGNSTLSVDALTMNGNSTLALLANGSIQSSGAANINGANNFISIDGNTWNMGTNVLLSGSSLSFGSGASISLTGSTLNGQTLALGNSTAIGRTTYSFGSNANSLFLTTTGTRYQLVWRGNQNNQWNNAANNWQQSNAGNNPNGPDINFAADDDVYFTNNNPAPISVDAAGVQAGGMFVSNPAGSVTFQGGGLTVHDINKTGSGSAMFNNNISLEGALGESFGVFTNSGSGDATIGGSISKGRVVQSGIGTTTLSSTNSYSNGTFVSAGSLVLGANNALGSGSLNVSGGSVNVGTFSHSLGAVTLDSGSITGNGSLTGSSYVGKQGSISARLLGNGGLTKTGTGKLTLLGVNSYTGGTTVDEGTLRVNGSIEGNATVASGATFGGTGRIAGSVNVSGVLSPGASIESFATGTTTFNTGSSFEWEFNSNTVTADLLDITGDLIIDGSVGLNLIDMATTSQLLLNDTKFTLISYTGSWNSVAFNGYGNGSKFNFAGNEWIINYDDTTGGSNFSSEQSGAVGFVTMTVVPEPSTLGLALLAGGFLVTRRRRNG